MFDPSLLGPDRAWFLQVNRWARETPELHGVVNFYAGYGVALFGLLLIVAYVFARQAGSPRLYAAAFWTGIGTVLAVGLNQPLARAVGEARPFTVFPDALLLAHRSPDPGFASDHATMAGAIVVGLFLVSRRLGAVALAAAVLMAFARVYVGAHFPVDVVAGLALGGLVTALGWLLIRIPLTAAFTRLGRTRLRLIVPTAAPAQP